MKHPQLQAIVDEFMVAQRRLHSIVQELPEDYWARRPSPERWSVGECVTHLNLTSEAYMPILRDGLARARHWTGAPPQRYHRDPIGWFLWKSIGPPVRFRTKTALPFIPTGVQPKDQTIAEYDHLQEEQIQSVREAEGLRIDRVKVASPFDARVKYNLYSCFTILPQHQHRHLWQAERALETLLNSLK